MLHYYKFKDITKNPLLQENLLNKKSVFRVLSTISRDSTITRYTITSVDCTYIVCTYILLKNHIKSTVKQNLSTSRHDRQTVTYPDYLNHS